ncbi:DNA-(apurinic or apyrimidinic site) lyase 2 isoform X2 [Amborella trichopoda]|uniref:DNA-(apurinic or apyrimidinic site) lyase 2 isoform X2 n=1 Tax=Amborella trichopoda TaxID=13333 RepID=UPI0005D420B3|nr:DNA-(apurinic or apyrimidinic site) lyase 2 isoform X2 [Amborella trichopoda]|eukprot:XP_006851921.2 DNA-(apurinic or apyrimidinic site) lyase 2 isoform X2 [Amborella trichopoda]
MRILTYNVNGLRQRVNQHGSLLNFLNSLQADIICLQETKLSRQELSADLAMAAGYESFFSCTRTSNRGRVGYSGVATFCRVESAFSSKEVALPLAAEEGFTGLLDRSKGESVSSGAFLANIFEQVEELGPLSGMDLLKVDSEGRCVITDHGHFVLFNIYGPRAQSDNVERVQFKFTFFKVLQKRWEAILNQGRTIFIVGDLNIAPSAMDCCDAGPDFEDNSFRKWLKSLLKEGGGPFYDVFRTKHPDRKEAYTCWSPQTGAEEFNFGSRIDLILIAGPCLHQSTDSEIHDLLDCHVNECDILTQFKRSRQDNTPRWKGGRSIKLEGSDHVPVFVNLGDMPDLALHSTPPLATRYVPEVRGRQQTLVSMLQKRQVLIGEENRGTYDTLSGDCALENCKEDARRSCEVAKGSLSMPYINTNMTKKAKCRNSSQLTLKSFFKMNPAHAIIELENANADALKCEIDELINESEISEDVKETNSFDDTPIDKDPQNITQDECYGETSCHDEGNNLVQMSEKVKDSIALSEWKRIQSLMQSSIPLCKGHKEPCVARSVKKAGSKNIGRGFYVCARAKGPSSNPEARCDHFQWATSNIRQKQR